MSKLVQAAKIALLFSILAGFPLSSCAESHDQDAEEETLWEVYQSEKSLVDSNLILVQDKFRLKKSGVNYHLKPLHNLRKRWGKSEDPNFHAVLRKQDVSDPPGAELYCGALRIVLPGHPMDDHNLSLSKVSNDLVILELLDKDCSEATYHDSHGGKAHAERT